MTSLDELTQALRDASVGDVSHLGEGVMVRPRGALEVSRAVAIAQKLGRPLRVRGEGDMLNAPGPGAVLVDLSRLERVLEVDSRSAVARVESGCQVASLDSQVRREGLTVGPLLVSTLRGSVGAWLAGPTRGERAAPPGRLETAALALQVVLAGGTRAESRAGPRSATGPDLDHLVVGGQGRLAILVAATVRLLPLGGAPSDSAHGFDDVAPAIAALAALCRLPLPPARARLERTDAGAALGLRYEGPRAARDSAKALALLVELGAQPLSTGAAAGLQARVDAPTAAACDFACDWSTLPALFGAGARADLVALHADGAFVTLPAPDGVDALAAAGAATGARLVWPTRLAPTDFWSGWGDGAADRFRELQVRLDPAGMLR